MCICVSSRLECFSNFLPSSFVQRKTIKMVNLRVCVRALWGTKILADSSHFYPTRHQHHTSKILGVVCEFWKVFFYFQWKAQNWIQARNLHTHPFRISKKNYNFFQLTFLIIAIRITGFNVKPKNSNCWPSIMTSNISVWKKRRSYDFVEKG